MDAGVHNGYALEVKEPDVPARIRSGGGEMMDKMPRSSVLSNRSIARGA